MAGELEPCGVPPLCPFALDACRLAGFDGPRGEEVLAAGDLGPDVDGGVPAFPVVNGGADAARDGRELADQGLPGAGAECPFLQCLASAQVVDERLAGCAQFCGKLAEGGVEVGELEAGLGPDPGSAGGVPSSPSVRICLSARASSHLTRSSYSSLVGSAVLTTTVSQGATARWCRSRHVTGTQCRCHLGGGCSI